MTIRRVRCRRIAGRVVASLLAGALIGVPSARAQGTSPTCTVSPAIAGTAADICRKAADLFAFLVPQVGVALAGGNHVLGEGGTLGGWGKRTVTLRLSAVAGHVPLNTVPVTLTRAGAVGDDFGAKRLPIPMPSLDAAIGLLPGVPLGVTNVGGVDLLAGAVATPGFTSGNFSLEPRGASLALSYGVRLGALQESAFVPGVSISWLRRKVPTLDLDYTPADDTLAVRNVSLTASTLRLVASKRFAFLGFAAGVGRDEIEGASDARAVVNEPLASATRTEVTVPSLREKVARNTAFVNASIGVPMARLVAEYGRSSAGTLRETLNTFGGRRANEASTYGSVGVTVRF